VAFAPGREALVCDEHRTQVLRNWLHQPECRAQRIDHEPGDLALVPGQPHKLAVGESQMRCQGRRPDSPDGRRSDGHETGIVGMLSGVQACCEDDRSQPVLIPLREQRRFEREQDEGLSKQHVRLGQPRPQRAHDLAEVDLPLEYREEHHLADHVRSNPPSEGQDALGKGYRRDTAGSLRRLARLKGVVRTRSVVAHAGLQGGVNAGKRPDRLHRRILRDSLARLQGRLQPTAKRPLARASCSSRPC